MTKTYDPILEEIIELLFNIPLTKETINLDLRKINVEENPIESLQLINKIINMEEYLFYNQCRYYWLCRKNISL